MYALIVVDRSGGEVGRFDYIDEATGLVSVGGGEPDHVRIADLPAEQAYLYISEGQMVLEDPHATGQVFCDGGVLDAPCYIGPENDVTVGPYFLRLVAVGQPPPPEEFGVPAGVSTAPVPAPAPPASPKDASSMPAATEQHGDLSSEVTQTGPAESAEAEGHYYQSGAAQVAMDLAYAPGGPAVTKGPLKLEALSGLLAGKEFELKEGEEYDVGRDEILEIPLDDPTVSRRHARLRVSEGGVMVLDLRSSNGTFLNGQPIKRELATPGDRLRFAEVGFKLDRVSPELGQPEQKKKKGLKPRRIILIAAGGLAVVALVVLGLAIKARLSKKKDTGVAKPPTETLAQKQKRLFREALERGQRHLERQQWRKAVREFETALEDYPSKDAKQRAETLLTKAKQEIEAQKIINQANQTFASTSGGLEGYKKSLALFKKVPVESFYSVEAKDKIEKISLRLAKLYADQGMTYIKGRRVKNQVKAHNFLCDYFKVLGNVGRVVVGENKYRGRLKKLEKKLKRKERYIRRKKLEYSPCKASRFLNKPIEVAGVKKVDPAGVLRKKYDIEDLVGILMIYHKGEIDEALRQLGKLKGKRKMRQHTVLLSEIHRKLAFIKGKLAEGDSALQTNDIDRADKSYTEAFKYERSLLPKPLVSALRTDAARRVAERYYKLGESQFKLGRYKEAFKHWKRGKSFDPSHTNLLNGMVRLEKEALRLFQQAQAAGGARAQDLYKTILAITQDDSPLHKKAEAALESGK